MSAPLSAMSAPISQDQFASQYDNEDSTFNVSEYARIMHEHTKAQLSTATSSARRRSQGSETTSNSSNSSSSVGGTPT